MADSHLLKKNIKNKVTGTLTSIAPNVKILRPVSIVASNHKPNNNATPRITTIAHPEIRLLKMLVRSTCC